MIIILCNHNTDFDFLLLASQSKKTMDFVATETMLRMGTVLRFFCRKFNVILHDKGSQGVGTIKQISSIDIVQRNRLIIHVKKSDVRYEFTGDKIFNAVKYLLWYENADHILRIQHK